jgi:hypothetical protein
MQSRFAAPAQGETRRFYQELYQLRLVVLAARPGADVMPELLP